MTVRGYTAKKRLVALQRLLALPLRSSAVRDASAHVTLLAASLWRRAHAHAKLLAVSVFVLCTLVDVFGIATRPLRAAEIAPPVTTARALPEVPPTAVAVQAPDTFVGPRIPEVNTTPSVPSKKLVPTKVATKKSVPKKIAATKKRVRRSLPVGILAEHEVASVLRIAGIPRAQVNAMTCTARFESSFNPRAVNSNSNGTHDTGLFQINDVWLEACEVTRTDLLDPIVNAKCARQILDKQGLKAWMAWQTRKHVCDAYKVGDFERKGLKTIRSIDEAHAVADHG